MADDTPSSKPEVTFEFNLPHGIEPEGDESSHTEQYNANMEADPQSVQQGTNHKTGNSQEQELSYREFSPGFSDDEGSGEAFERSWPGHQAKKQAVMAARGKKSPRRSDNESENPEINTRAKKPRQSLFGGADEDMDMDIDEQVNDLLAPTTPGLGLGNRMSSLTLDQQHDGDEVEHPVSNSFGLACSDVGSVRDSPPPSDDEVVIPPDMAVSSLGLLSSRISFDNLLTALL